MSAKPATYPRWARTVGGVDSGAVVTPTSGEQDTGLAAGQKWTAQKANWLFLWLYKWILFIDDSPAFVPVSTNVPGLSATGNGTGAGGVFTAGATNANGLTATASGTGAGLNATGGGSTGTSGNGVTAAGGAGTTNGVGGKGASVTGGAGAGTGASGDGGAFTGGTSGGSGAHGAGVIATAGGGGSPARGALGLTPQAAPSAPVNGDTWIETTSNVMKARINAVTKTILTSPIARGDEPTVGQQISSSSAGYNFTGSTTVQDVTNLTVTITTTGRPVLIFLQGDGSTSTAEIYVSAGVAGNNANMYVILDRGGTNIVVSLLQVQGATTNFGNSWPPSALFYLDPVGAGTYTYKIRGQLVTAADSMNFRQLKLVAMEL